MSGPKAPNEPKDGLKLAHQYPGLNLLCQNNRKSAVDGIRKLASRQTPEGRKKQQGLLRILEAFIKPLTVADETPNPKTKAEAWVGDDFTGSMRTLYRVLSSYIFCKSGMEQTQISGRLRLALESGEKEDSPSFDMMFLAHPHRELEAEAFRWRETRIAVDRRYGCSTPIICHADQSLEIRNSQAQVKKMFKSRSTVSCVLMTFAKESAQESNINCPLR